MTVEHDDAEQSPQAPESFVVQAIAGMHALLPVEYQRVVHILDCICSGFPVPMYQPFRVTEFCGEEILDMSSLVRADPSSIKPAGRGSKRKSE
jgi:hypothetical protein